MKRFTILTMFVLLAGCSTVKAPKHPMIVNMLVPENGTVVFKVTGGRPNISKLSSFYQEMYFKTPIPVFSKDDIYTIDKWEPRGNITLENTDKTLVQYAKLFAVSKRKFYEGYMGSTRDEQIINLEKWHDSEPVFVTYSDEFNNSIVIYSPKGKKSRLAVEMMTLAEWKERK